MAESQQSQRLEARPKFVRIGSASYATQIVGAQASSVSAQASTQNETVAIHELHQYFVDSNSQRDVPSPEDSPTSDYAPDQSTLDVFLSRDTVTTELDLIPFTEILDFDSRPTFVLDLGPNRHSLQGASAIEPMFCNAALASFRELDSIIKGSTPLEDLSPLPDVTYDSFLAWTYSITPHDRSREAYPTSFVFADILWTSSTIRKRFRVISGNRLHEASSQINGDLSNGLPPEVSGSTRDCKDRPILPARSISSTTTTHNSGFGHTSLVKRTSVASTTPVLEPSGQQLLTGVATRTHATDWTVAVPDGFISKHTELARSIDWGKTALGPMQGWSQEFRQVVNLLMNEPQPRALFWGKGYTMMYNESYIDAAAGTKHPALMGTDFAGPFAELWEGLGPIFEECRMTGCAVCRTDDQLFIIRRGQGFAEECYYDWSFVPLYEGTSTVKGFWNSPIETTEKVLTDRRMRSFRSVFEKTSRVHTVKDFWASILPGLDDNEWDVPFALLYSVASDNVDDDTYSYSSSLSSGSAAGARTCLLQDCRGTESGSLAAPVSIDLHRSREGFIPSFREAMRTREPTLLRISDGTLPQSLLTEIKWRGWGEPCREAAIIPLRPTSGETVMGFLLIGINPRRPYDEAYETFITTLDRQLASSLASTILLEEETRRAELEMQAIKLAQQKLAQELDLSQAHLQIIGEMAGVGLFRLNPSDGRVLHANDAWYRMYGIAREESGSMPWSDKIDDSFREFVADGWHQLSVLQKPWTGEFKLKKAWEVDGEVERTWVLASAYPQFVDGELVAVLGSVTDISHLKWNASLQARRLEEAEETRRKQNAFIDITSHEMRNPLSAILQCAEDISQTMKGLSASSTREVTPEVIDQCKDSAETIVFCAMHQKNIVDDILTVSKLDSDLLHMVPAVVQPKAIGKQSCKMFEADALRKGIALEFIVRDSVTEHNIDYVYMDANRVLQVLINLITNSIKFTQTQSTKRVTISLSASRSPPPGGMPGFQYVPTKMGIEQMEKVTDGEDWGTGEALYIGFLVEDTGVGLTSDEMKNLFIRFSQASPRTHVIYGGSGLGLFISRQLTELHGGRIGVASTSGVGSNFSFYVRVRRAEAVSPGNLDDMLEPANRVPSTAGGRTDVLRLERAMSEARAIANKHAVRRNNANSTAHTSDVEPIHYTQAAISSKPENTHVMIVEDNLINQRVLRRSLEKLKYNVTVANHGLEALNLIEKTLRWTTTDGSDNALSHTTSETPRLPLDIVLMDMDMPIMDGQACARRIRELEREGKLVGHLNIICVSANVRTEQINAAREAGMDSIVSKPFGITDLVAKMNSVLGVHAA